ncbi:MAG: response regulator [Bdellovibrionota bacterium]
MSTKKILIVDDEDDIRNLLVRTLQTAGHQALTARDGRQAFEILKSNSQEISLILLDLLMPVMGGWEFLTEFRKAGNEHLQKIPIIVLTAVPEKIGHFEVAAIVNKPFDPKNLLTQIGKSIAP